MEPGQTIAHYEIVRRLGQGGMGVVYQARDTKLDRTVALKFLPPQLAVAPEANARFIREAKAASALDHANICTIYEIGETDEGALYIAMAFYEGHALDAIVREGSLPLERVMAIATQLASALERAHDAGIVHRDLKPANVMVTNRGEVKLLDFGIAKLTTATGLTDTGSTLGTASYMSPEQVNAQPVDHRSDLWSFGVVLYEMLTGRTPFDGQTAPAVMYSILGKDPAPLLALRPDTPASIAGVVDACLRKDPAERPQTARAIREALAGTGPAPAAIGGEVARRKAHGGRRPLRWPRVATGALIAALTLGLAWTGYRTIRDRLGAGRGGAASTEARRDVIAVLPFTVRGAPDLAYLAEGMVDLVSGKLDGAGTLRAVDPRAVIGGMGGRRPETLDVSGGAQLAATLGAGRFITGQLVGLPGRVSLSARLHDSDDPAAEEPLVTVEGSADSLYALVDQLATGLLANTLSGANARIQRSAAQSSRSLVATKEFLRGEQFHRRGQFDSASASYNRALAADSTFALAHLMKSMNNQYTYDTDDYLAAVKAERYSANLPERDRSLIAAFLDQQAGRMESAERRWIAHLQRYPDEVKAILQLGLVYNRSNPRWGRPIEQSRPYFERVLALEPENVPALHQLARLDATLGFGDSLAMRAGILERVAPGTEWMVDVQTMSAFVRGDSAEIARFIENFPRETLLVQLYAVFNAMRFSDDPRDADRLLARRRGRPANATGLPEDVVIDEDLPLVLEVFSRLFRGRHDEVRAFLADPARRRTPTWDVWDAELVATGLVPVDSALLAQVLSRVEAVDPVERLRTKFEPLHDIFTPAVAALERDVAVARLLAMQGRFDEAWAIQRRLAALPQFTAWESLRDDAAGGLAAELHYLAGDRRRALDVLRGLRFQVPTTASALAITTGAHARFRRAELELELGDPEVARQLYEGIVLPFEPTTKLFLVDAYERLGRIHEAAGRVREAMDYYDRFVRCWADADAALVPRRRAAEDRLDALRARVG
jgi:tetratricopeptide (TPR) repeat protein